MTETDPSTSKHGCIDDSRPVEKCADGSCFLKRYRALTSLFDELLQYSQALVLNFDGANRRIVGNGMVRVKIDEMLAQADTALDSTRIKFQAIEDPPQTEAAQVSSND